MPARYLNYYRIAVVCLLSAALWGQATGKPASQTQVVLLGTGTPLPDPDRAGPSTAIVVNDTAYLVDFGTGIVRRAAAARDKGIAALEPKMLRIGFLTHLHSDHTLGLPDAILTPWTMGRKEPLELYGPPGTKHMVDYILQAYAEDIKNRTEGLEQSNRTGYRVNVHEVLPGVVYRDKNVTVTAFEAHHGSWEHSYGYVFKTADRTVVVGGDASGKSEIVNHCNRCDVLINETYTNLSYDKVPPHWQQYRRAFHTSATELAAIANKTRPGLLILYHRANPGCDQVAAGGCREAGSEEQLLKEIRQQYNGKVVAGHDLDVF